MSNELDLLSKEYNQNFKTRTRIPHGFFQMSYVLTTEENKKYFLKTVDFKKHIITPKQYFVKLKHLADLSKNLDFIPKLIHTKNNHPYLVRSNKCYVIQEYIEGKSESGDIEEILRLLKELHEHPVKEDELITETFKVDITKRRCDLIIDYYKNNKWFRETVGEEYLGLIEDRYKKFELLKSKINKFNLCYVHKDPLSNTIQASNKIYIIDWDDLSIAHKEADLWSLINRRDKLTIYENFSGKKIDKDKCEYYALQNFFLYYEAYIQKYLMEPTEKAKEDIIRGIKEGMLGWFESVYKAF